MRVRRTLDFRRIEALPRRKLTLADAQVWADVLTEELAIPGSGARLRPWQAMSLAEIHEHRAGVLGLPVGVGKTLIYYLAAVLCEARLPALVIPANLRAKTYSDFASYAGQWRAPRTPIRLLSREELALEQNEFLLRELNPDLLMSDETDELANFDAAAVQRMWRFRHDAGAACIYVGGTGTLTRTSILPTWHLFRMALGNDAPVPELRAEAQEWARALDEQRRPTSWRDTFSPGPMGETIEAGRRWYLRRITETPGIIIVDGDSCDQPLHVNLRLAHEDPLLDEAFATYLETDESPSGIPTTDPLSRWRLESQMGCGLEQYWDPPPPQQWVDARRAVAKLVRQKIEDTRHARRPLDTERQVLRRYADDPVVRRWNEVKGFVPKTRVHWISTSAVNTAVDWLSESDEPSIVWVGCVEFARALAKASRLPYFAAKGIDADGNGLHAAPRGRSMIVSWHANKKGFNLQSWSRMSVFDPPQSAKWLEQMIGRAHRSGQRRPVTLDYFATSGATIDAFSKAFAEARFARETTGLTQKILRATVTREKPQLTESNEFRWASRQADE